MKLNTFLHRTRPSNLTNRSSIIGSGATHLRKKHAVSQENDYLSHKTLAHLTFDGFDFTR